MRVVGVQSVENSYWTSIAALLDAQATPGKAHVYSGTCPAPGVAVDGSNVRVMTFTLQKPCAASIDHGILTFAPVDYAIVESTAEHTFVRFEDGSGNWVMDVDSGVKNVPLADGSLAAWQFNAASYTVGALIVQTSLALRFPT